MQEQRDLPIFMHSFSCLFTIVLSGVLVLCAPKSSAAEMLAFYEIKAEVNGSTSVARTSKPVEFGTPLTHEFGEYQIHMLFEPTEQDLFSLTVTLNSIAPSTNAIVYTMLSDSFEGQISSGDSFGQSTFTIDENEINISIVLRLSRLE